MAGHWLRIAGGDLCAAKATTDAAAENGATKRNIKNCAYPEKTRQALSTQSDCF
ncbi:MAG: hypothetical protein IJL52_10930 [Clostridia bacterium]|nr:hypothetical protein [Clostridia bacterium]